MKIISKILLICLIINLICIVPAFAESERELLLNYKLLEIDIGKTERITASYSDLTEAAGITFQSANDAVASVDSEGTVTATGVGLTRIIVSDGTKSSEVQVAVNDYTGIRLDNTDIGIAVGQEVKLTAELSEEYKDKSIKWETGKSSVATVSDGTVSGVANGITSIKASLEENPEIFAECKVAVGKLDQEMMTFVSADKEPNPLWKAVWVVNGKNDFKTMTSTNGSVWSNNGVDGNVSKNEMTIGRWWELGRAFCAPASGKIAVEVKNMNNFINLSANSNDKTSGEYLKVRFEIISRGEVVKSFDMESAQNSLGGYYRTTTYNGAAEDKESETSNSFASSKSMQKEIGTVELDVVKGEEIIFIPRRIEGTASFQLANWDKGFMVSYISTDAVTGIKEMTESLTLKSGEIIDASAKLLGRVANGEKAEYKSNDENLAAVSNNGIVKAVSPGNSRIYFTNIIGGVQGYTDVTVLPSDFSAGEASYTVGEDNKTASVSLNVTSSTAEKLYPIFITRDRLGRPIGIFEEELLDIAKDTATAVTGENIDISKAEKIDIYLVSEDKSSVIYKDLIEING